MKYIAILVSLMFLNIDLFNLYAQEQNDKLVLAVSDFGFRSTENLDELKQIAKELRSTIVITLGKEQTFYKVVERERIYNLLDETWWAKTGVVNPDTAAKVGEAVGAEAVIVGDVSSLKGNSLIYIPIRNGERWLRCDCPKRYLIFDLANVLEEGCQLENPCGKCGLEVTE
ncbi:hypothetical protein H8E77_42280 [bacterium]|nr:hypothetical protein [bacterium]